MASSNSIPGTPNARYPYGRFPIRDWSTVFIGVSATNTITDMAAAAPVSAMAIVDCLVNIWFDLFSSMPLLMSSWLVLRLTDVKYKLR